MERSGHMPVFFFTLAIELFAADHSDSRPAHRLRSNAPVHDLRCGFHCRYHANPTSPLDLSAGNYTWDYESSRCPRELCQINPSQLIDNDTGRLFVFVDEPCVGRRADESGAEVNFNHWQHRLDGICQPPEPFRPSAPPVSPRCSIHTTMRLMGGRRNPSCHVNVSIRVEGRHPFFLRNLTATHPDWEEKMELRLGPIIPMAIGSIAFSGPTIFSEPVKRIGATSFDLADGFNGTVWSRLDRARPNLPNFTAETGFTIAVDDNPHLLALESSDSIRIRGLIPRTGREYEYIFEFECSNSVPASQSHSCRAHLGGNR